MNKEKKEDFFRIGSTKVSAIDVDITTLDVDAIVCSANTRMQLGGHGSVAGAIVKATSGKINQELAELSTPVLLGGAAVTSGAGLPCRHIIHVATHGTSREEHDKMEEWGINDPLPLRLKVIGECIYSALEKSGQLGCHSLAIPALAAGSLGIPVSLAVEATINSFVEAITASGNRPDEVCFATYKNPKYLAELREALESVAQPSISAQELAEVQAEAVSKIAEALLEMSKTQDDDQIGGSHASELWRTELRKHVALLFGLEDINGFSQNEYILGLELISQHLVNELVIARADVRTSDRKTPQAEKDLPKHSDSSVAVDQMPLPVAFAVSMVESSPSSLQKVENLRKALSSLLRYLAAIALAEYNKAGSFDEELNEFLRGAFSSPLTDGSWRMVASHTARAFYSHPAELIDNLTQLWHRTAKHYSSLNGALDRLIKLRNEIHSLGFVDDSTAKDWLGKALHEWEIALREAQPLLALPLVYVETIRDFIDEEGQTVEYGVRWLTGERFVPRTDVVQWRSGLKKGKLYLTYTSEKKFLPLSPFLEYEHCDVTKTREVCVFEQCTEKELRYSVFRFPQPISTSVDLKPGFFDKAE